jgi:hypothetical protein
VQASTLPLFSHHTLLHTSQVRCGFSAHGHHTARTTNCNDIGRAEPSSRSPSAKDLPSQVGPGSQSRMIAEARSMTLADGPSAATRYATSSQPGIWRSNITSHSHQRQAILARAGWPPTAKHSLLVWERGSVLVEPKKGEWARRAFSYGC